MSTATAPAPGTRSPWTWAALFAVYSVVMFTAADSDRFGDAAAALAWLVFLGAGVYWWNPIAQHLGALTGAPISTVKS